MDRGAWWATIHGAAKSRTRLKQRSTHAGAFYTPHLSIQVLKTATGACSCRIGRPGCTSSKWGKFLSEGYEHDTYKGSGHLPTPRDFFTALLTPRVSSPASQLTHFSPLPSSTSSSSAPPSGKAPGNSRSSTSLLQSRAAFPGSAHQSLLSRAQGALLREAESPSSSLVLPQGSLTFPVNFILTFREQELGSGKPCVLNLLGFWVLESSESVTSKGEQPHLKKRNPNLSHPWVQRMRVTCIFLFI